MSPLPLRRPLLLTGSPAAGLSSVAGALAAARELCAVVEVADVRAMVRSGAVQPWRPGAAEDQHRLAAVQACLLAASFTAAGVEVVLELIGFADRLRGAALVITGEGCLDEQTLFGKAPAGVASAARLAGVARVWLVVNGDGVDPVDRKPRVRAVLAAHYEQVARHRVRGATVVLYRRR